MRQKNGGIVTKWLQLPFCLILQAFFQKPSLPQALRYKCAQGHTLKGI